MAKKHKSVITTENKQEMDNNSPVGCKNTSSYGTFSQWMAEKKVDKKVVKN